jgi:hypothetical protein
VASVLADQLPAADTKVRTLVDSTSQACLMLPSPSSPSFAEPASDKHRAGTGRGALPHVLLRGGDDGRDGGAGRGVVPADVGGGAPPRLRGRSAPRLRRHHPPALRGQSVAPLRPARLRLLVPHHCRSVAPVYHSTAGTAGHRVFRGYLGAGAAETGGRKAAAALPAAVGGHHRTSRARQGQEKARSVSARLEAHGRRRGVLSWTPCGGELGLALPCLTLCATACVGGAGRRSRASRASTSLLSAVERRRLYRIRYQMYLSTVAEEEERRMSLPSGNDEDSSLSSHEPSSEGPGPDAPSPPHKPPVGAPPASSAAVARGGLTPPEEVALAASGDTSRASSPPTSPLRLSALRRTKSGGDYDAQPLGGTSGFIGGTPRTRRARSMDARVAPGA